MRSLTGAVATLLALCAVVSTAQADQRATQRIAGGRFAVLAARVARALPADPDAALVAAFTVPDQTVAAGSVALVVRPAMVTPSYVNVPIEVDVNGRQDRVIFVGYRVVHYVETAVAAHDLAPGSVLVASDLKMARVPYLGHNANGVDVLVGRHIASSFTQGQAISIDQTQTNQIVKPGASVVMIVRDGGVVLVADVVARNGGGLGDQVTVYNASTNKTLSGTVVGPDRVELDLLGAMQ
jgi:flagella basal body P-ring formation protein FlgA